MSKQVTLDIETMADLVWSWGEYASKGWSAVDTVIPWYMIGFGAKWMGKKTRYYSLDQYKNFKPLMVKNKDGSILFRKPDLHPLLDDLWAILNEADDVIGWNSKKFDLRKVQDLFISLGYPPFSPVNSIDVMLEKRKLAASNSYKLDRTGEQWGTGRKVPHNGFSLWLGCIQGDKKSLKLMKKYCIQDVDLTERNYLRIRPWMKNHPPMNITDDRPDRCPTCGSGGTLVFKRYRNNKTTRVRRYLCVECTSWCIGTQPEKLPHKLLYKK